MRRLKIFAFLFKPVARPVNWFVSIFTEVLPYWWYKALKLSTERGMNWLFNVIGIVLVFAAAIVQGVVICFYS